jgi:hypothetical protein
MQLLGKRGGEQSLFDLSQLLVELAS